MSFFDQPHRRIDAGNRADESEVDAVVNGAFRPLACRCSWSDRNRVTLCVDNTEVQGTVECEANGLHRRDQLAAIIGCLRGKLLAKGYKLDRWSMPGAHPKLDSRYAAR